MSSATSDRRMGLTGDKGVKAPCQVATVGPITLSGEQTIDGFAALSVNAAGAADRVVVTSQADPTQNGVYDVNTGTWQRSLDANGNQDLARGTLFLVSRTGRPSLFYELVATNPIVIGSSAISFAIRQTISTTSFITAKDFGAVGNGTANDTLGLQEFLDSGGGYIPDGVYMTDELVTTHIFKAWCGGNVVLKKRSGTTANSILLTVSPGSEGSEWDGGAFDGNRSALGAAFTALNPVQPDYFAGWIGMKTNAADITVRDVTFQNWVSKPAWFAGDRNIIQNIQSVDCGSSIVFGWAWFGANKFATRPAGAGAYGQAASGIIALRTDNAGIPNVAQHAIDFQNCLGGAYVRLLVSEQGGDTLGSSTFASGITSEHCEECQFDNWSVLNPTADALNHLGISFLGAKNCPMSNFTVYNIAGLGFEHNSCIGCTVTNLMLDGNYRATTAVPYADTSSYGISYYCGTWNDDRTSKSLIGTSQCRIVGGTIKRFTYGGFSRGGSLYMDGVSILGNQIDGLQVQETLFVDHFAGNNLAYNSTTLNNCVVECNGSRGITGTAFRSLVIVGGSYRNNGQNSSASDDARAGITGNGGDLLSVSGATLSDDQLWTDTGTCSFEPQTAIDHQVQVYIRALGRTGVGQIINIVNGTGAGDYVGRVVDISVDDLVTLRNSVLSTLSATGNTTALTGTWTGSGAVLTGTGTLATTEIRGQTWVTNGSQYRRVVKALTNLSITLNDPFTAPLSGATLTKLTTNVSGIPSQTYGIRAFGSVSRLKLDGSNLYDGDTLQRTNLSTPGACLPGSVYFRRVTVTTIGATVNFFTGIPAGHRLIGVSTNNDVVISGGGVTSWELRLVDVGLATLESIQALIALTKNTKVTGSTGGVALFADGNILRAVFAGGNPTAGSITCEAMFRVDGTIALPNA